MTETGYASFNTTIDKTNRMLKEIEQAYGWPKERRNQFYAALRSVLHAVRDRLNVNEVAQLGAQLTMLVRGIYYDGWDPDRVPEKLGREDFLQRVRQEFPCDAKGGVEPLVQTVLRTLRTYVAEGEWKDVRSSVPGDLRALFP